MSRTVAQNSYDNVALCLRNTKSFIGRILQVEPKKLASVVKPKTHRALRIVVDFVGDHLKDKKSTEFNTLDKLLSRRSGSSDPVSNNPSYSTRVCAKCVLKIWTVVERPCFLKANLNPVVADVEATSDDCETQQRWKRKSKSSTFGKTPRAEPASQASVLKTHTPACFCSAFKELAFDSLSFSETIAS